MHFEYVANVFIAAFEYVCSICQRRKLKGGMRGKECAMQICRSVLEVPFVGTLLR